LISECSWLIVTTEEWKMRQTTGTRKSPGEKLVKDIKREHHCPAVETKFRLEGRKEPFSLRYLFIKAAAPV
jgi:hypothetical protein